MGVKDINDIMPVLKNRPEAKAFVELFLKDCEAYVECPGSDPRSRRCRYWGWIPNRGGEDDGLECPGCGIEYKNKEYRKRPNYAYGFKKGMGIMIYANSVGHSHFYIGQWNKGRRHGLGLLLNGKSIHLGEFVNGHIKHNVMDFVEGAEQEIVKTGKYTVPYRLIKKFNLLLPERKHKSRPDHFD